MKVQAKIKIMDGTRSGISRSTGNPWQSKDVVVEVQEPDNGVSTIAARVWNKDVIEFFENHQVGDVVEVDIRLFSKTRNFTYKDGSPGYERGNDVAIVSAQTPPNSIVF